MGPAGREGGGGSAPVRGGAASGTAETSKPSPLAAALRELEQRLDAAANPGGAASALEGEALERARRLRADAATRRASLLLSGLMQTPDCALELFREGRPVDPALDLRHLKQLREVLDRLHAAITANDPARWREVESIWRMLGSTSVDADDPGRPLGRLEAAAPEPAVEPAPLVPPGPLSTAPTVRGDLLSPWLRPPPAVAAPASKASKASQVPVVPAAPAASVRPSVSARPVTTPPPARPALAPAAASPATARAAESSRAPAALAVSAPLLGPPTAGSPVPPEPRTAPRIPAPPRPSSLLDRTAEAACLAEDRTSLHVAAPRGEKALPFRSRPPPDGSSGARPPLGPDLPMMEESEGVDETRRMRLHVMPFKPKPVPFELNKSEDRTAPRATVDSEPSIGLAPLPFVPAAAPAGTSAPGRTSPSWEGEERTALIDVAPPSEEPTTRSEASLLMSTMEVETRRTPTPGAARAPAPSPVGPGAARVPATAGADPPTSLLDLEGYAAYRAELSLRPDETAQIRQRYKLHGAASYERLDAYWQNRLAQDPALRQSWEALCQRYAAWFLLKQK